MLAIATFFIGPIGRYVALALAAGAALGWYTVHERNIGAAKVTTQIEEQNKEADHEAEGIRNGVQRNCAVVPLPADCVRDGWSRD
jgi:hypothetical protein